MKATLFPGIKEEYLTRIIPDLEIVPLGQDPDVIFVRSTNLHNEQLPTSLFAICRAGTETDKIPVKLCSEDGIVVFNAPGANANSVKELTMTILGMMVRNIIPATNFLRDNLHWLNADKREKVKGRFVGEELAGKRIGVIGAGRIGSLVIKRCLEDGMSVCVYDPYAPEANLHGAERVNTLHHVSNCDFISLHAPLREETRNMINAEVIAGLKGGVRILNFARAELVDHKALYEAMMQNKVGFYASDFYDSDDHYMYLLAKQFPHRTIFPLHQGASTEEAEQRAQEMVARQFLKFWQTGAIENSVNFPSCNPEPRSGNCRFMIINRNIPGMEHKIKGVIAEAGYNICYSLDKSPKGSPGYNIVDVENADEKVGGVVQRISEILGVTKVRVIR